MPRTIRNMLIANLRLMVIREGGKAMPIQHKQHTKTNKENAND